MRSFSRVMADAVIDKGARLLEHTLVMAGERVPEGETRQGWPTRVRSTTGASSSARVGTGARAGTGALRAAVDASRLAADKGLTRVGAPLTGSVVVTDV